MAMKLKYKFSEEKSSARVNFQAFGKNYDEIFANSATAMMDCMVDLSAVSPKLAKLIKVQSKDIDQLLVSFLNEVVYYKNSEHMLLSRVDVKVEQDKTSGIYRVTAKIVGEPINYKAHLLRCDVNSAQSAKVEKKGKTYEAKVTLEI